MTTKLPAINQRNGASMADVSRESESKFHNNEPVQQQEYISPFRLPSDDEVFVYREVERKKREDMKHVAQDLKIWEKKTGTSRKPLRLFKDVEVPTREALRSITPSGYNTKDRAMIVEAQRIINERRKGRDAIGKERKEGIVELKEQKKEMFLVERTVGIIEKEREQLIQKAGEKEDALKKSDDMLEKDWSEFEAYKQNNKQETDQAIQRYNQEVEARKRTETDYKIKNNELTSLKADKTKNEEFIQKYLDAKHFLDKLTPKEVLDQQGRELKEKVNQIKQQWLEREITFREETQSNLSESLTKGFSHKDTNKKPHGRKTYRQEVEDLEHLFQEKLDKGDFDEIEEIKYNQSMYFADPEQLVEVFQRLEEGNLALIQMMQDAEQALENLKNSLKQKKNEFDRKIGGLRDNKMALEKSKNEKLNGIKALTIRSKEPILSKSSDGLVPLRKKIVEVVNMFKEELKGILDIETMSTLDLLATVELHLEKQILKLNEYKPARVAELKKQFEDVRKRANRKIQLELEQKLAEERSKKASERALEKTNKRQGRIDMMKSQPIEKKEVVTQVVNNNAEEEDMKYFKPNFMKI